ncbi:2207_t:CDS:2 [Entrophospora sp. SA101]|nr:2207_t:CDS:2 [Entrophospora sp. SA101]
MITIGKSKQVSLHKRKFNEEPPSPYNLYYSSPTNTTYTPTTRMLIYAKGHKSNKCPNTLPKLKAKQEEKDFNNLASVKEKIRTLCFIQQGYTGKVVIENFPDLTQLNLGNNELEEIIIHNCPDLKLVQVAHNKLTKLKIENCPNVQENYTHNNQLTNEEKVRLDALGLKDRKQNAKYPLDKRNEVEKLDLSSLGLQGELNLEGFTNLKSLDCSDNELTNLDKCEKLEYLDYFTGLSNLHTLMITSNELEEVDLSDLTSLKSLNCGLNNIDALDLSNNLEIEIVMILKLKKVSLCNLNVKGCENLVTLDYAENSLTELDISNLKNLEFVSCKENLINKINANKKEVPEFEQFLQEKRDKPIKEILANPNNYSLEDILKLEEKELKEKLVELATKKHEEIRLQKEREFMDKLRKR